MQESPNGLVPTPDFVRNCLEPNPDFNDGSLLKQASIINESAEHAEVITLRGQSSFDGMSEYTYSVLEFAKLIDSSSMDSSHWNQIIKCLAANWKNFDAFVILHGTDTLAYTASDLSFMLRDIDKTVIVTGSQLSMYVPHSDAHDNLLDSLTVAATFIVPEVGVVLHHHLYRGTRVTKVSAFNLAAFTTPNAKPLASFPNNHGTYIEGKRFLKTCDSIYGTHALARNAKATFFGRSHVADPTFPTREALERVHTLGHH